MGWGAGQAWGGMGLLGMGWGAGRSWGGWAGGVVAALGVVGDGEDWDLPNVTIAVVGTVSIIFNLTAVQLDLWPYLACGIVFFDDGSFCIITNSRNWPDRDSRPRATEKITISPTPMPRARLLLR
ncbi:hypothetical protein TIFTF001_010399 [Ficus carica]|uniref:Uncharacterized protein n=1 Tax=Ficus carica TaxID=3494 RepID=A0AA88A8L5_FICCA|nr:hypothetical protein TIFTF001_010399 [Ficus carica]